MDEIELLAKKIETSAEELRKFIGRNVYIKPREPVTINVPTKELHYDVGYVKSDNIVNISGNIITNFIGSLNSFNAASVYIYFPALGSRPPRWFSPVYFSVDKGVFTAAIDIRAYSGSASLEESGVCYVIINYLKEVTI